MFGMGRKKQIGVETPKPTTIALPKVFTDQYGTNEEAEEITKAVEDNSLEEEISNVQNKIDQLKAKQIPTFKMKEKWELVKKVITQEVTFLRNNQTGEEYQLEDGQH